MHRSRTVTGLLFAFAGFLAASASSGLANRVFVSASKGNDANSCNNILTPCQTLQGAVNQTAARGEVIVLDSGGYGVVTITQSLKIEAPPGIVAFIHPPSPSSAISISAGATDVVTLRGLTLSACGGNGVDIATVGELHVENFVIDGCGSGIIFTGAGRLYAMDSVIRNGGGEGIFLFPTSGGITAAIEHCRFENNSDGVNLSPFGATSVKVSVKNSVSVGNFNEGFRTDARTGGSADLTIEDCLVTDNPRGIFSSENSATSVIRVSNTTVTGSTSVGLLVNSPAGGTATLLTRGNNTVEANATNGTFTGTFPAK